MDPDLVRVCRRASDCGKGAPGVAATTAMPTDVLRDSARRLGLGSLACAAGFAVGTALDLTFARLGWFDGLRAPNQHFYSIAGLFLSLGMFVATRRAQLGRDQFIALGVAYEIVGGLLLTVPDMAVIVANPGGVMPGPTWLAVWIAIFASLIPAKPLVAVTAGLATASTSFVGLWLATLGGRPWPDTPTLVAMMVPNYMVAVFMAIPAVGLYKMSMAVAQARDLGSYRLVEKLGAGGMGEVWRAAHRMLTRPAAIKLISSETLAHANGVEVRELIRRFELEAQTTASLSSPHTVALYDFGVTDDGTLYYVMELLNGLDLEQLISRFGPQPAERTVNLLLQMCESLDEAHAHGLIHRDIKPANVHVSRLGRRYDCVKVLDFGLVKRNREMNADMSRLTVGQETRGTPAFIPPEMASGRPIDARTDLYAVGCVAYWLLTGRMVFEGQTHYEVISHHLNTAPVPASERTELPVPPELDRVILDCLAKDPAQRPASARELSSRLSAVPFAKPWTPANAEAWWKLHLPQQVVSDATRPSLTTTGAIA